MSRVSLAPAYDILSTVIYESTSRSLPFHIGEVLNIEQISEEAFRQAAAEAGLGRAIAKERVQIICDRFEKSLNEATEELKGIGFRKATGFAEAIKKQCFILN